MHSSRMRTARLLSISHSIRRGGLSALGGVSPGHVCMGGVCRGVYPSMQWGRHPPPVNMTGVKTLPCPKLCLQSVINTATSVADPGFPAGRRGANPKRGSANLLFGNCFPKTA